MSHLGQEVLQWVLAGEGASKEVESFTVHLLSCDRCRNLLEVVAEELPVNQLKAQQTGSLKPVFDVIEKERHSSLEALTGIAEWAALRRLPSRRSQRDRVRMSKGCHTLAVFRLMLEEVDENPAWDEAEFLASLAFLSLEAMSQRQKIAPATKSDLEAEIWIVVANARRRAAEWEKAHRALNLAQRSRQAGTRDCRLEAKYLAIYASTMADEGHTLEALNALESCKAIYQGLSDWPLLARTRVKTANVLEPIDPTSGLEEIALAIPLIPPGDPFLLLSAQMLRVECFIRLGRSTEALHAFRACSQLLSARPTMRLKVRARFIVARLLDALGLEAQGERLFDDVIERDIEHELYKDAYLDLLYLFDRHLKAGYLEKAARVCRKALSDSTLSAIAHDQMRTLWSQLLEATQRQAIGQELLRDVRQYLSVHWKHPAASAPVVAAR
jgi:hypothetical protein